MKLIECHVSGFGAFNDYKVSFNDGFNVILQPNGWGKTTLSAYIKAMLYGFDRKRTRNLTENERLRYKPWHGGNYGGTLDFEYGGQEYRILRTFGATGSADRLKVISIDTGKAVDLAGQEPGEWVFGLDAPAFQKSIFVGQNGMAFDGSVSALRNRLNSFVNEVDDTEGLDKALEALDTRRKHYLKQGGHGRIADITGSMGSLLSKQKLQDSQVGQVMQLHGRIFELDGQVRALRHQEDTLMARLDEARKSEQDTAVLRAAREQLATQKSQAQEAYEEFVSINKALPGPEDIEALRSLDAALAQVRKEEGDARTEEKAARADLEKICRQYAGNLPTRKDLESRRAALGEVALKKTALDSEEGDAENGPAVDPSLESRMRAAIEAWPAIQRQMRWADEAKIRQREAQAAWGERKQVIQASLTETQRCDEGLPADAREQLDAIGGTADSLRAAQAQREECLVRMNAAQARLSQVGNPSSGSARSSAAQEENSPRTVVPVVLVVVGIVAAVAGLVALTAPLSYALAVAGLVVAVLGYVLLMRAKRARADAEQRQKARKAAKQAEKESLQADVAQARAKLEECEARVASLLESAGLASHGPDDIEAALGALETRRVNLTKALQDAQDSRQRLAALVANILADSPRSASDDPVAAAQHLLSLDVAPGSEDLDPRIAAAQDACDAFARELALHLQPLGTSPSGELALDVERAKQALRSLQASREKVAEREKARRALRAELEPLIHKLDAWAASMGVADGMAGLTEEKLETMARDAAAAEQASWQAAQACQRAEKAHNQREELTKKASMSLAKLGLQDCPNLADAANSLAEKAARKSELDRNLQAAGRVLAEWDREHAGELARAGKEADSAQVVALRSSIDAIVQQREELAAEQARCETERKALLRSLEEAPQTAQQLRLLSSEKQKAASKLFVVQKTAEYLKQAREALDRRYLGGLSERFNDYTASWLEGSDLAVDVGVDFDVSVRQDGSVHEAASYSTGYQDLLDICLRMALVDTIFETEQPFIVMDDPFVNLDQANIARALTLLALLAHDRQIVYLTCHPSRTEDGADSGKAAFTLPAQRASRELPRARAKREAQEREQAQAQLVASYRVTGPTQGRADLQVADAARVVTTNIATVRLATSEPGKRDNAFEVHFIDARGRSLCERQTVEVIDGHVVPDRVRFCLSTRSDSGDAFDLIVHEQGKPETELVARVPYNSAISFNTSDFDL